MVELTAMEVLLQRVMDLENPPKDVSLTTGGRAPQTRSAIDRKTFTGAIPKITQRVYEGHEQFDFGEGMETITSVRRVGFWAMIMDIVWRNATGEKDDKKGYNGLYAALDGTQGEVSMLTEQMVSMLAEQGGKMFDVDNPITSPEDYVLATEEQRTLWWFNYQQDYSFKAAVLGHDHLLPAGAAGAGAAGAAAAGAAVACEVKTAFTIPLLSGTGTGDSCIDQCVMNKAKKEACCDDFRKRIEILCETEGCPSTVTKKRPRGCGDCNGCGNNSGFSGGCGGGCSGGC